MSCESCEDIEKVDNVPPGCKTKAGCPIPPLSAGEARLMEIRSAIVRLQGLVEAEAVLKLHGATVEDLELLAAVEDELHAPTKHFQHGEITSWLKSNWR